tara:strand:+ start:896 stop:1084 length:189 start_codon:yes stop_codon:yes gene_type:complete
MKEKNFAKVSNLYFAFMNYLDDSTVAEFIETDPDNPEGTRDTEKGNELFNEIESILNERSMD